MRLQRHFHPEFGIFQPSAELRRMIRVAVLAAAFGAAFGAFGVVALLHRDLLVLHGDTAWAAGYVNAPPAASIEQVAAPPPDAGKQPPAASKSDPQTWSLFDNTCFWTPSRKRRHVRVVDSSPSLEPGPAQAAPATNKVTASAATQPDPPIAALAEQLRSSHGQTETRGRDHDRARHRRSYAARHRPRTKIVRRDEEARDQFLLFPD